MAQWTARFDNRGWRTPLDLEVWETEIWRREYYASDYTNHYLAAHRGNHISVARMEWFLQQLALARLRGQAK